MQRYNGNFPQEIAITRLQLAINDRCNAIKPPVWRYIHNMSRLRFNILFLFLVCVAYCQAQTFILGGRVTDSKSRPIELATVAVESQAKVVLTNLKGEFTMTLREADSVKVKFSMPGYKSKTRTLKRPRGKQTLQVQLFADNLIDDVEVKEKRKQTTQEQTLSIKDTRNTPSTTGNAVEEMIQQQAGVSTHSELTSQYNVRGGNFDENSVYINGIEIYRPFLVRGGQQEGLSVINADMTERVTFSTGGFAAMYGDKMSSTLSIDYRHPEGFEGKATASLLGGSAYIGYGNEKFSWSNGVRYKTNRYLLGTLETTGEYRPDFLDYQTFITYQPNERWNIEFIGDILSNHYNFTPEDRETKFGTVSNAKSFKVYFDGKEKDLYRTLTGALSIKRYISRKTWLRLTAQAFHTDEQERYDILGQYWLTQTETDDYLGVGSYMEHARNYLKATVKSVGLSFGKKTTQHDIRAAFTYKWEHIRERSKEYELRDSAGYNIPQNADVIRTIYSLKADNSLSANRVEAYIQDTYRFTGNNGTTFYTLNYGLRFSRWSYNKENTVSPRVSLGVIPAFNHNLTLRFATGLYCQTPFFRELRDTVTVNGTTTATLNRNIKSQRAVHIIAGFDYDFKISRRPFRFTAEAYCKLLRDIIPYSVNNVKIVYDGKEQYNGHAAGIDLKLYGEFVPDADSWITFSLMDTKINMNGRKVPLPTDQRYAVNLFYTDYFPGTDRWRLSLKLAFADGLPFCTPHKGMASNTFRAPAYKRADIGMSFKAYGNEDRSRRSPFKTIWVGVDCLNLFGVNNVNSYYWITDISAQQYAVPNYLTGRMLNAKVTFEF